jgi:hypothetical protein
MPTLIVSACAVNENEISTAIAAARRTRTLCVFIISSLQALIFRDRRGTLTRAIQNPPSSSPRPKKELNHQDAKSQRNFLGDLCLGG